jgi:MFS family permease
VLARCNGNLHERHRANVEVAKPVLAAAALAIVLGLLVGAMVPTGGDIVSDAAALCGLATWILPLIGVALWSYARHKPRGRSSLVAVGYSILIIVLAAMPTVAGVLLAVIAFVFARQTSWAWSGLAAIAAFWMVVAIAGRLVGRGTKPATPHST